MILSPDRFETSSQQIAAELGWLELVIKREIALIRRGRTHHEKFDEFSGLYVSEEAIDAYLAEGDNVAGIVKRDPEVLRIEESIRAARDRLDRKAANSLAAGIDLRLGRLANAFGLDLGQVTVLLACLAPDVDLRFQKFFAYLQNDVSKRRPMVQLLHRFGLGEAGPPLGARSTFGPEGRLLVQDLLSLPAHKADDCFPLMQPRMPDNVLDFLAGIDRVDTASAGVVELSQSRALVESGVYFDRHRSLIREWTADRARLEGRPIVLLGPSGSGRSELISAFAAALNKTVLTVDCSMLAIQSEEMAARLRPLPRDARMLQAVVHVKDVGELQVEDATSQIQAISLGYALARRSIDYLFLTSGERVPEVEQRFSQPARCYELPWPSVDQRTELWREVLPASLLGREPELAGDLATRFLFTPAKVRAAALRVDHDPPRAGNGSGLSGKAYFRACRLESNQNLRRFGKKMTPAYWWDDVVLPPDTRNQLQEICACVRYKQRVYEGWGFGAKFSLGKGLNVLFSGASGTGKTMCAEIIAGDLQLDAFKLDLSCVVSKYIGETERNLSRIFEEAETSNSILFFDEADALFGKRSEIKDAHDRYANIEINYLLQKLDDYEGIVILATNLRGNLDKAFTRRLNYLVDFPFPDEHCRERIWAQVFPGDTPLHDDVKLDFLARKFKLAGGNIKNIAVNSAFLAAADGGRIGMEHLILATKREYQKLGRLCSKSEFGPYFNLVQEPRS